MHLLKHLTIAVLSIVGLIPTASAAGNAILDRRFDKADLNDDLYLTPVEFLALEPRGKAWVDVMFRFNRADTDDDNLLSLLEFRASNGARAGVLTSKSIKFTLADLDKDGYLDPEEYARTVPQVRLWRMVIREFDRKDKDDDLLVSPREFGILGGVL